MFFFKINCPLLSLDTARLDSISIRNWISPRRMFIKEVEISFAMKSKQTRITGA